MIHDTQSAQISQKQDERNIYVIMKTMCPPGYHHNGFVATHALGHTYVCIYVCIYLCLYIYTYILTCVKVALSPSKKNFFICFNEKCFLFHLKSSFCSQDS